MRRGIAASAMVTVCAIGLASWGTDGYRALTAESARRLAVTEHPRSLPEVVLEDQDGRPFRLQDYRGRLVAVEFIYSGCQTLCRSLGVSFRQIRERMPVQRLGRDLVLVSISFDSTHDDPPRLKQYARTYGADGVQWRVARIRRQEEVAPLLSAFGVVAIADGLGGYEHNAAIHLLDRDSRLAQISDIGDVAAFVEDLNARL